MKTFYTVILLAVFILSISACKSVELVHNAEPILSIDEYMVRSAEAVDTLNFSDAIKNIEKAEKKIEDKSVTNQEYISLLVIKSNVYSFFERLDEAEETLLRATGISDGMAARISDSKDPLVEEEYEAIIDEIRKLTVSDDSPGYHIALSLLYNVLGDSNNLRQEQQAAMDIAGANQDEVLSIAMGLYRIRGRKIDVHSVLREHLDEMDATLVEDQLNLAWLYHYAGWFEESEPIVDRYLDELSPEDNSSIDNSETYMSFLYLKMNIETSLGRYQSMKSYESKILDIDPTAFDEAK